MDASNELAVVMDDTATVATPDSGEAVKTLYMSFKPTDYDSSVVMFNALNAPTHKLSDFINKTVRVEHVCVQQVEIADGAGTVTVPKVILVDTTGQSFVAISKGVYNSIRNAILVFGQAPWVDGIPFVVKQVPVSAGSMLTLELER